MTHGQLHRRGFVIRLTRDAGEEELQREVRGEARRRGSRILVAVLVALAIAAVASAHIERASYWPDPAPDNSVSPPAGGNVPLMRTWLGAGRQPAGADAGGLPARLAAAAAAPRCTTSTARLRHPPPDHRNLTHVAAQAPGRHQHRALEPLQLPRDPARGHRLAQQRPRRGHARRLHRADLARAADQRPGLRPVQDHQRQEPGRGGLLRLPVPLPQRPEPDRGDRPRAGAGPGRRSRRSTTATGSPTSGPASAATCRSRAPA